MLAAEIGTKLTVSVGRPAVAHRQHFREKDATCPFAPLRGHDVARTISGVRMLGCAIRFR